MSLVVADSPERGEVVVGDSPEREGVGGGARRGGAEGKELDDMQDACLAPTLQAWVHPSPAVPPD